MKIGVCIKQVPDSASKIKVKTDHMGIAEEGLKFVISPYDEFAVEEALRTKDKFAGSEVTVIVVGPKRAQEALRTALAMGCDKAVHINSDASGFLDSLTVAKLLATHLKEAGAEIVFTGRHAIDDDNAQVSQMLAEILGWPHVTNVSKWEPAADGKNAKVERDVDGGAKEIWEVELPAVLGATKGLNEPRYASLKGIMAAKSKPLKEVPAGTATSTVTWTNYQNPPERKAGKIFKENPKEAAAQVVRLLREEAKVI